MEASPILSSFHFQKREASANIDHYEHDNFDLIITGIGPYPTALICGYLLQFPFEYWINLGVAAALTENFKVGEMIEVGQCRAYQHQHPFDHSEDLIQISNGKTLMTLGQALHDSETKNKLKNDADLIDMEGYAIALAAKRANIKLKILKSISDHGEKNSTKDIVERIPKLMENLWQYCQQELLPKI